LYFRPDKVRTWSGQNQSLSGFEKIRMVGKGISNNNICFLKFYTFTHMIESVYKPVAATTATARSKQ